MKSIEKTWHVDVMLGKVGMRRLACSRTDIFKRHAILSVKMKGSFLLKAIQCPCVKFLIKLENTVCLVPRSHSRNMVEDQLTRLS